MIVGEVKTKIDSLWDRFYSSGNTSNPLDVIKQITYMLFIKRLDDLHTAKERKANMLGQPIESPIFDESKEQQSYRWRNFKDLEAEEMFTLVRGKVFDFIKGLGEDESAFSKYMKNAYLGVPNARAFEQIVTMIDAIKMEDADTKGDVYEYMLSKIATSGINGQFRTPRHIIKMMTEMMHPTPEDTICDPACGTAGFLVAASEYVKENYKDSFFKPEFQKFYSTEMFNGCDKDDVMIGISAMNLIQHGIENPNLYDQSSLEDGYNVADKYSMVLANPPFTGSLDKSSVAKSLSSVISTPKTELLFLALMLRIMKVGGRAAVIIPDGVLFGAQKAAKDIRKIIVDNHKLEAVISMPSGVFKPYAGVSTAILIFTKTNSGGTDNVWFYDMRADGFTLNDKRTTIEDNDIPDILERWTKLEGEADRTRNEQSFLVPVNEIQENGYDLSINKYKEIVYEQKEYDTPAVIIGRLESLDLEISAITSELKTLLNISADE